MWLTMFCMSDISRRNLCLALPALSLIGSLAALAETQTASAPPAYAPKSGNKLATDFSTSQAWAFSQLPLRYSDAGAPTRDIAQGRVPTGELVEIHETTVAPGKMPHPAHQHPHEEFILVRTGKMAIIIEGVEHPLPAGSVGYTAPNQLHGFKNIGTVPASYFIFSLSKQPLPPK